MDSFSLYVSGPDMPGCPTPHIIHAFSLQRGDDGDIWPSIVYSDGQLENFRSCGGRFRVHFIGGGGSLALFKGLAKLFIELGKDHANLGNPRIRIPPVMPRLPIERHMDDAMGFFRMSIRPNGSISIDLRPLPARHQHDFNINRPIGILIPPTTPYRRTYRGLIHLWDAIAKDNRDLGDFAGAHA